MNVINNKSRTAYAMRLSRYVAQNFSRKLFSKTIRLAKLGLLERNAAKFYSVR